MNTTRLPAVLEAVESRAAAFAKVLPPHIKTARFIAAAKTALLTVPGLVDCDRQSVVLACMRAASDGLVPDGKDAVLVVGRSKRDGQWVNVAQYWPMSQGLQKVAFRSGLVTRLEPRLVREGDQFELTFGTEPGVIHKPLYDGKAHDIVGAYCVASMKGGGAFVEWMEVGEIVGIMRRSKSWDREKNQPKGPWLTDFGEMARKTVLRRCLKYLPTESLAGMHADDEDPAESEAELIEGTLAFPSEHKVGLGTYTSGEPAKSADTPIEDATEVAEAEIVREEPEQSVLDAMRTGQPLKEPPAPEAPKAAPKANGNGNGVPSEVTIWKSRLRALRTSLEAAADGEACEHAWNIWNEAFSPDAEVTAAAKGLIDKRLYELKKSG